MNRPFSCSFRASLRHATLGVCLVTMGCGSSSEGEPVAGNSKHTPSTKPAVATESADIEFDIDGFVPGGGEVFACAYVQFPKDRGEIAIASAESHFTPGSHHFLVFRTNAVELPDGGATVHPCTDAEQAGSGQGTYYEAQAPESTRTLPEGVAHVFKPGEVLLLTSHYLNTSSEDLSPHVKFVLHPMDRAKVKSEAGSIFFYNPFISIPPNGSVSATRSCPVPSDINLALLWSHMHSRGVSFHAVSSDPDVQASVGDLYASDDWSEPVPRAFPYDPPVVLKAGSSITYTCGYKNTTSEQIVQGLSAAKNEMCILHGMYWPRLDAATEQCFLGTSSGDGSGFPDPDDVAPDGGTAEGTP